jgi:hypothetical protein
MAKVYFLVMLTGLVLLLPLRLNAQDLSFYIVAKNLRDINFSHILDGCNAEAQKKQDVCFLVGPKEHAQPREQLAEILHLISTKAADGMAISVINSDLVSSAIAAAPFPVITFDSPLIHPSSGEIGLTHVGVNDEEIGRALAEMVMADYPQGGRVCIFSDINPNLERRVNGVRLALSANVSSDKLTMVNPWYELDRCPWITDDRSDRVLLQMKLTLEILKPDAIISVGHWPVYFPDVANWIEQFSTQTKHPLPRIYSAIGSELPWYKDLLKKGIVSGFVEVDFFRQGQEIYNVLLNEREGKFHARQNLYLRDGIKVIRN